MSKTNVIKNQSQNEGFFALSALKAPVIDGDLSDWDWSGRIKMFADFNSIDTYYNETAAMYDDENLYIAFKITDKTPMENPINPYHEGQWAWRGDCIQLRILTDRLMWVNLTWHHEIKASAVYVTTFNKPEKGLEQADWAVCYITDENGVDAHNHVIESGNPEIVPNIALAYKKFDDNSGYFVEARLPWKLLYAEVPDVEAGMKFRLGIEIHWNDPSHSEWYEFAYCDNMQPGQTTRMFFWTNYSAWGDCTLTNENNITPREYILPENNLFTGILPISLNVPKNAEIITVVAETKDGNRIGPVVSALPVSRYITEEKKDENTVTVMWNGMDAFDNPIGEGEYVFKAIVHDGFKMKYDMTFYNPGTPPWRNLSQTGAWGADHSAPVSICASGDMVYIGWPLAEGGSALIGIGSDGKKVWGVNRGAVNATALGDYIYSVTGGGFYASGDKTPLTRFNRHTGKIAPFIRDGKALPFEFQLREILNTGEYLPQITDLSSFGGTVAISTDENIYFIDALTAELKTRHAFNRAGSVEYGKDGRLYIRAENKIYSMNVSSGARTELKLELDSEALIGDITFDNSGNIVLFDKGADCRIKAFSPETGKLLYTAGIKGGRPLVGKYDKQGLVRAVSSIAVDNLGQIWAVENWEYPRRVSVWGRDGKLVREYIGNAGYAGTGTQLHDQDPDKAYSGAVEFKLDRENRTWEVTRVLWVPDMDKDEDFPVTHNTFATVQHFRSSASGKEREYMFEPAVYHCHRGSHVLYMETDDSIYKPVFAMGRVKSLLEQGEPATHINYRENRSFEKRFPHISKMHPESIFVWNDLNGDGIVQEDECVLFPFNGEVCDMPVGSGWGNAILHSDLSFSMTGMNLKLAVFKPTYFTEKGAPVYKVPEASRVYTEGARMFNSMTNLIENTGWVLTVSDDIGATRRGIKESDPTPRNGITVFDMKNDFRQLWFHPNDYPGVHGSHSAPIQRENGFIIGPIKMLGFADAGRSGEEKIFFLRGNLGCDYVFTTDGYYIATLFTDGRMPVSRLPETEEELTHGFISEMNFSEGGEPFGGWAGTHSDGKTRLITSLAREAALIVEISGFETLCRLPPVTVKFTQSEMEEAHRAFYAEQAKAGIKRPEYIVRKTEKSGIDWDSSDYLEIRQEGAVENCKASLMWDEKNLYAKFKVEDPSPMLNNGQEFQMLFKTGDVCDIQLSPRNNNKSEPDTGDMRILLTVYNEKPACILMMPADPKAVPGNSYTYTSPVESKDFDTVRLIPEAKISLLRETDYYEFTAEIPLDAINMEIYDGMEIRGDFGIITSDAGGQFNQGRYYYFNGQTGLTSDLPHEAWLQPHLWGKLIFNA